MTDGITNIAGIKKPSTDPTFLAAVGGARYPRTEDQMSLLRVIRVGPTQVAASLNVCFTSNSVRISAAQRIDAKCQELTSELPASSPSGAPSKCG